MRWNFGAFCQNSRQMTRKLQPPSAWAILVFIQSCSRANEAQKRLLMEDHKFWTLIYTCWALTLSEFTISRSIILSFRQRYQCHNDSSDVMKFILAAGDDKPARSQRAYPNMSGCQLSRLEEFPQWTLSALLVTHKHSNGSRTHAVPFFFANVSF